MSYIIYYRTKLCQQISQYLLCTKVAIMLFYANSASNHLIAKQGGGREGDQKFQAALDMIHCKLIEITKGIYILQSAHQNFVPRLSGSEGSAGREVYSQIAMLTRIAKEQKNKMEEFQHKLLDKRIAEVYNILLQNNVCTLFQGVRQ